MSRWIRLTVIVALAMVGGPSHGDSKGILGIRFEWLRPSGPCFRISGLLPGSAAERAGVLPGDIVVAVNGVPPDCSASSAKSGPVPWVKVGDRVVLILERNGKNIQLAVIAEALPTQMEQEQESSEVRSSRLEAAEALIQRLAKTKERFAIVMGVDKQYRYEGNFTPEEAELLHWYDYERMVGQQMGKLLKPGRHEFYIKIDPTTGGIHYEDAKPDVVEHSSRGFLRAG